MYSHTLLFLDYAHVALPILIVASSFVQDVRNFGRRIAAAINSGSFVMWPNRVFNPACMRNQKQLHCHVSFLLLRSTMETSPFFCDILLAVLAQYCIHNVLWISSETTLPSSIYNCRASTRGLQYFSVNLNRSSLAVSRLIVGSSQPIWTFSSACKMLVAWATGLMTVAYSARNARKNKTKTTPFYNTS